MALCVWRLIAMLRQHFAGIESVLELRYRTNKIIPNQMVQHPVLKKIEKK
jgi:hypothetical protein